MEPKAETRATIIIIDEQINSNFKQILFLKTQLLQTCLGTINEDELQSLAYKNKKEQKTVKAPQR